MNMYLVYNIPSHKITNLTLTSTINKISLTLSAINYKTYQNKYAGINLIFHNSLVIPTLNEEDQWMSLYYGYTNTFIVEPILYRTLTHFGRQCDPRVKPLFDDSLTDDNILDCVRKRSIDAFDCIAIIPPYTLFHLDNFIFKNNYTLCNNNTGKGTMIRKFITECINEFLSDCELRLMKVRPLYEPQVKLNYDEIHITIIPKPNLIIKYAQVYVMDGWELIYQLGGVMGMWLGWSAVSISNIKLSKQKILYYLDKIKIILMKIYLSLITYCHRFYRICKNSITICHKRKTKLARFKKRRVTRSNNSTFIELKDF